MQDISEPRPRRTQQERKTATRSALLDATIACIVELGYARTTTTEVVKRAGVSQGALFKHYPTRSALVAAAAEQLFRDLIDQFAEAFSQPSNNPPSIANAVKKLWEIFLHPHLQAVYRLYAEAPADPELFAALTPVVKSHADNILRLAEELFPPMKDSVQLKAIFDTVIFAMQGASFERPIWHDPEREKAMLDLLEQMANQLQPLFENHQPITSLPLPPQTKVTRP